MELEFLIRFVTKRLMRWLMEQNWPFEHLKRVGQTLVVKGAIQDQCQAEGKTVRKVAFGPDAELVIAFDDDTYLCVKASRDWGGNLDIDLEELQLRDLPRETFVGLGLLPREEYELARHQLELQRVQEQKAKERETYERLKARYEGEKENR